MKLLLCIIAGVICPSMHAMRACAPQRVRVATPPARAFHVRPHGLPPFKIAPKPHLAQYVQPIVARMNENEQYYYRANHSSIQFWAIDGKFDIAAEQLEKCSDITKSLILDQVDENGQTLLIKAAKAGYHEFMDFLLQQRANAAVADYEGLTALSINPTQLTRMLAHCLLDNGIDVTAADTYKRQALHYLAKRRASNNARAQKALQHMSMQDFAIYDTTNGDVARMIIPEGASTYARDVSGKTPIDYALDSGHIELLKAFMDCGADRDTIIEKAPDFIKQELIDHCKLY